MSRTRRNKHKELGQLKRSRRKYAKEFQKGLWHWYAYRQELTAEQIWEKDKLLDIVYPLYRNPHHFTEASSVVFTDYGTDDPLKGVSHDLVWQDVEPWELWDMYKAEQPDPRRLLK